MRKRKVVRPRLESVESRVVLSAVGIAAQLGNSVRAPVSQVRAHEHEARAALSQRDQSMKLQHRVERQDLTAAVTARNLATEVHRRAKLLIGISHPDHTSTSTSTTATSGVSGLFKSLLSSI